MSHAYSKIWLSLPWLSPSLPFFWKNHPILVYSIFSIKNVKLTFVMALVINFEPHNYLKTILIPMFIQLLINLIGRWLS